MHPTCREIEPDLVAVATGEGSSGAEAAVAAHVARCRPCRDELSRYRTLEGMVAELRRAPVPGADPAVARAELEARLADIRSRAVAFGVFDSPLGRIVIARSELGVSLVQYLDSEERLRERLAELAADAVEDRAETEPLHRELLEYLTGRRTRLDWPLDLRAARSEFQRRVLEATARLPYGAVTSYTGIARRIGAPRATRAVAQALRRNPLPIVIPCHRVVGNAGDLVGYAGQRVGLKRRLLSVEGVPVAPGERVDRQQMYCLYEGENAYCLPTCGSISTLPLAELTLFASRGAAEGCGLTPCETCRPDVHPLPA
jgi:methylated-DNA-[protein]-cysteine S-methyltransferase